MTGAETIEIVDERAGLRAFLVIDDTSLGPAAGGVRTRAYASAEAARADAAALARAMTIKCALAGLPAGGGKCVVMDHAGLDRARAFAALGERVEALGGRFRTAGDLGTTAGDLAVMARHTRYVHPEGTELAAAAARGLLRCAEAAAGSLAGRVVAVQGAGAIGAAAARAFAAAGARVLVADLDEVRARAAGGEVVSPEEILAAEADVLAPCAAGGVITRAVAERLRARVVCGAANNILADPDAEAILRARGVTYVPDPIASAGAVIAGIARTVMGIADPTPLIDALGETARAVLAEARATGRTATEVAEAAAWRRIRSRPGA